MKRWRLSPAAEVVGIFGAVGVVFGAIGLVVGVWLGGREARARARESEAARVICAKSLAEERDLLSRVACPPGQRPEFTATREHGLTLSCVPARDAGATSGR